jgi:hypothetical protein
MANQSICLSGGIFTQYRNGMSTGKRRPAAVRASWCIRASPLCRLLQLSVTIAIARLTALGELGEVALQLVGGHRGGSQIPREKSFKEVRPIDERH